MTDAVEKVLGILLTRNNRIIGLDFLNRTCAFEAHFESILLSLTLANFNVGHRAVVTRNIGSFSTIS